MACYHPLRAFQLFSGSIVFKERPGIARPLLLACGQCIGCRQERARQWAVRCVHEASLWPSNCFVTLTYRDEHLPAGGSLQYRDVQLFLKRLRKRIPGTRRFYMCGEYGEDNGRPHYHLCLFNTDFVDKVVWKKTRAGFKIYRSPLLEELWPLGHSSIGELNYETAAYTARYVMKKITGQDSWKSRVDEETGLIREQEFTRMSLKPGIGGYWVDRWMSDVYPHDYVVSRGKKLRPPKYYDVRLARIDPDLLEKLKDARLTKALENDDNSFARLAVRELVAEASLRTKVRLL